MPKNVHGNADTATKLKNQRSITLQGAVNAKIDFDGSEDVNVETKVNQYNESIEFAEAGKATITRRGNVVTVFAAITVPAKKNYTLSNYAALPEWALPSASIAQQIKFSTGTNTDLDAAGFIIIRRTNKTIMFCANNKDEANSNDLTLCFSYVVD